MTNSSPAAVLGRLDLDLAVGELAATAGLLLVAGVGLGRPADRLLVGDARRVQLDLGAEAALHPLDDHLDVDLGQPGDDLLAGLRVAVHVEGRVLLAQPPHRRGGLLLVALRLRLVGEGHHRRRQVERREGDRLLALAEHVAGLGLLQLGDRADVAGAELVDGCQLVAERPAELADPLLLVPGDVDDLGVGAQRAPVDAEEVDPPRVGVGEGLEDVGDERPVLVGLDLDLLTVLAQRRQRTAHRRRGQVLDQRVEQPVGAEVAGRDAAGDGEDLAPR